VYVLSYSHQMREVSYLSPQSAHHLLQLEIFMIPSVVVLNFVMLFVINCRILPKCSKGVCFGIKT